MEKQRWEESEKRRAEERRSEKRKNEKKEDAGARKGSQVAKHYVFPMICGSGGSKSRLAKVAVAEPERWKIARRCGAKHISKSKCTKHTMLQALLEVEMSKKCTPFRREARFEVKMFKTPGARDCAHLVKCEQNMRVLAFPKTMARVGHLKRVWKDAFSMAGAIQETCSSEMLGGQARALISWGGLHFGASDLQFWEDDIVWQVQHFVWPGITFSYFIDMDWKNRKTHWYEAVSSAHLCTQLSTIEGSLAELLRFWCCQLQKLRRSRRIVSFFMLPTSKIEEVSQNSFVFKLAERQIDR